MNRFSRIILLHSIIGAVGQSAVVCADEFFAEKVAPIFQQRCVRCHNDNDLEGEFSLQSADSAFADGYISPRESSNSAIIDAITPVDGEAAMPKEGDPLSDDEIAILRTWIDDGAKWPTGHRLSIDANLNWWSLRPLRRPELPDLWKSRFQTPGEESPRRLTLRTPIDAFIQQKLDEKGLVPSPEANRRTLIRRLYFDLIGLPPTPEQIDEFVADDRPEAYGELVDNLLASKHYGERWARHWLDVVHYADTHGYDKDKLRPNAWPYRDYVIRSFNQDKPYARFVQEQVAGDALWPHSMDGITATGFIAAGPWDFIGHAEVPETKIDGRIARHLDRDDMVSSTMNTFCSVTVQCARCHNHKFDPITQEHYYSLQSVFAALDRADRPFDADENIARRRIELSQRQKELMSTKENLDKTVADAAGNRLGEIDSQMAELTKAAKERPESGYHCNIENRDDVTKWVQVDLGEPTNIKSIRYVGCYDDFAGIGAGFGFPVRFRIDASNDPGFSGDTPVITILNQMDSDADNPGIQPQEVTASDGVRAQYVRVTATKLATRKSDYIFALSELMVFDEQDNNVARGKAVSSLDSIEAPPRWQRKNLVDGYYPGGGDKSGDLLRLQKERSALLEQVIDSALRSKMDENDAALKSVAKQLETLPSQQVVYAGTIHSGSGAFKGTGANGGKPRPIHVLHRGDILSPRSEVGPGTVPVIEGEAWKFELPKSHHESERRVALAKWLTRHDNPLTWRSIVNRIWQYHFGRGLVDSPNDFGRMGQLPSHPELLDWLAAEFRDGDQRFKQLHKMIVLSSAYRQASDHHKDNAAIDSGNQFLWRMNRRRLSAEEIRDAVLAISGKLNGEMYGPAFQLFVLERPEHSPHYEYHKHDPNDPKSHRRSVYRFIVRSQPDPFMTTLDCADSSQSVAKRDETLTALQALSLLNNKFMLRMAEHFSKRLESSDDKLDAIGSAYRMVTGQVPSDSDRTSLAKYAEKHGMDNLCRLLFNLNQFVFVD